MNPRQFVSTSMSFNGGIAKAVLNFRGKYVFPYNGSTKFGSASAKFSGTPSTHIWWYAGVIGNNALDKSRASSSTRSTNGLVAGVEGAMTLRFTSPQAARVVASASLIPFINGPRRDLATP